MSVRYHVYLFIHTSLTDLYLSNTHAFQLLRLRLARIGSLHSLPLTHANLSNTHAFQVSHQRARSALRPSAISSAVDHTHPQRCAPTSTASSPCVGCHRLRPQGIRTSGTWPHHQLFNSDGLYSTVFYPVQLCSTRSLFSHLTTCFRNARDTR
jgi:hypothetical protein